LNPAASGQDEIGGAEIGNLDQAASPPRRACPRARLRVQRVAHHAAADFGAERIAATVESSLAAIELIEDLRYDY